MVRKWKGIKEIREKATKELIEMKENGFLFYSAPYGYRLVLSIIINKPPMWKFEIKDFGIPIDPRKNEILRRGLLSGDEGLISDENNPILELIKIEKMDLKDLRKHIKEERQKARLKVQGRAIGRNLGDLS